MNRSTVVAAIGAGMFVIILTAGIAINASREATALVAYRESYTVAITDGISSVTDGLTVLKNGTWQSNFISIPEPRYVEMDPVLGNRAYVLSRVPVPGISYGFSANFAAYSLPTLTLLTSTNLPIFTNIPFPTIAGTFLFDRIFDMEVSPNGSVVAIAYRTNTPSTLGTAQWEDAVFLMNTANGSYVRISLATFTATPSINKMPIAITPDSTKAIVWHTNVSGSGSALTTIDLTSLPQSGAILGTQSSTYTSVYDIEADNNNVYFYGVTPTGPFLTRHSLPTISTNSGTAMPLPPSLTGGWDTDLEIDIIRNRLVVGGSLSVIFDTLTNTVVCSSVFPASGFLFGNEYTRSKSLYVLKGGVGPLQLPEVRRVDPTTCATQASVSVPSPVYGSAAQGTGMTLAVKTYDNQYYIYTYSPLSGPIPILSPDKLVPVAISGSGLSVVPSPIISIGSLQTGIIDLDTSFEPKNRPDFAW